jgi:uncharacterized protein YqjF (DUF2071 family)
VISLDQRLLARNRPAGRRVGRQRWNHLLFAHWAVEPAVIQATLPRGLFVDTHEGSAYLGIVPFYMERIRPAWLPPLPWVSWFLELNVRTYVHDAAGRPGVWFYSLDCNQPIAVWIARRFFNLPYFHAQMKARRHGDTIDYFCQRRGAVGPPPAYRWSLGTALTGAPLGSLEFFLVERYLLFSSDRGGRLFEGRVHHQPYQLHVPKVTEFSRAAAEQAGFRLSGDPVSVLGAAAVDVSIFPLKPLV